MFKYAVQRILLMLMTLTIITLICFVLIRMLPLPELPIGDPHTPAIEARREAMGYNKPYLVQFGIFVKGVFTRWDWGVSKTIEPNVAVTVIMGERLATSIKINILSVIFSVPIGNRISVQDDVLVSHEHLWR